MLHKITALLMFSLLVPTFMFSTLDARAATDSCAFGSLEVSLPGFGKDKTICDLVNEFSKDKDGKSVGEEGALRAYASIIANLFIVGIVGIGLIMIVIGGYMYMTAGGDASQVTSAKTVVISALLGIMLALSTFVILRTINPEILGPDAAVKSTTP